MRIKLLRKFTLLILLLLSLNQSFAANREIALTIDDLPFVGNKKNFHLNMILSTLKEYAVPATGFIVAGDIQSSNWTMLQKFRDAGFGLGNHTVSHANLNKVNTEAYLEEIELADQLLLPILTEPKYFRFPYLATGSGEKKEKVMQYLVDNNYQIAPITIDSRDFLFNRKLVAVPEEARENYLNELKPQYLDFIWQQTLKAQERSRRAHNPDQAQILLIHANLLNAYTLPDIINLYKEHGFTFVSLQEALKTFTYKPQVASKNNLHVDKAIETYKDWD
ncbi:polysaccharide deacetylase [Legionella beliardensis]|uniref:Polysaccharide deacetylase n=1 Tax=Legionella beliardensis TaxID=91822 RepID=A0A378I895_9GAMM|nr:polysaccharide deacetylase family protein [Legionella beliardensis]STX28604.1 polysaccharide deacetylase [Legionella beliardensis]